MMLNRFIKSLTVTVSCVLAVGFLLLLVDEGSITGKFAAVADAPITASTTSVNVWVFVILIFFIIVAGLIVFFKKKDFFLKK